MIRMVVATARMVWNGPFYIGTLTRPVTIGEVAMKLLETMWRLTIAIAGLTLVVTAAVTLWSARPLPPSLSQQIAGTATLGNQNCDATYPLHVALKNKSNKRVGNVNFTVAAYEPGRSTNLAVPGTDSYSSDVIIPAGKTLWYCWTPPELSEKRELNGLVFIVTVRDAQETTLP